MDPAGRMTCNELLDHSYFDHFRDWFKPELDMLLAKDAKKIAKSKSRMHVSTVIRTHKCWDTCYRLWLSHCIGTHTFTCTPHITHTHPHTYIHRVVVIVVGLAVWCHQVPLMPAVGLVLGPLPLQPMTTDTSLNLRHSRRSPIMTSLQVYSPTGRNEGTIVPRVIVQNPQRIQLSVV